MAIKTSFIISAQDDTGKAIDGVTDRFKKMEGQGEKSTSNLAASFSKLAGPIAGVVSLTEGFSKLVNVTREFDVLNAGLITATGSAENATIAFSAIQEFASTTPYDLQQVAESFTKLVNYGLVPSERALTSYGNTASSMGKGLDQMIEAVADATTGEFERLKEFGIKASKEGDQITFTFRGVTTTVKNSADEIENYLVKLGENNFAGAMAQRMDTLDGALSNLADTWDQFFLNISKSGLGKIIADGVNLAIDALNHFNTEISSGKIEARLDTWTLGWRNLEVDAKNALKSMGVDTGSTVSLMQSYLEFFWDLNNTRWKFVFDMFLDFPNKVNIAVTWAVAHITELANSALLTYETLKKALNPFDGISGEEAFKQAKDRQKELEAQTAATINDKIAKLQAEKDFQVLLNSMLDEEIAKREQINQTMSGDRLANFQIQPGDAASTGGGGGSAPAGGAAAMLMNDQSIDQWSAQEQAIIAERQKTITELQVLRDIGIATEMETEQLAYESRLEMLRVNREQQLIDKSAHDALVESLTQKHQARLATIERQGLTAREVFQRKSMQDQTKQVFGELAGLTAGVAQHNEGMFKLNKAAGIANAIINTYQGVSMSLAAYPMPLAAVMAAAHLAAGLAQVSAIKSQSFGGSSAGTTSVGTAPVTTAPSNIAATTDGQSNQQQQQQAPETRTININMEDGIYTGQQVRKLIEAINEEAKLGNVRIVA